MCGIAGLVGPTQEELNPQLLSEMANLIRHRGPDDEGIYVDEQKTIRVTLIHRRLSIIDLASGHQPLSNEDGSIWVVFNGEIYNFKELRGELEAKGHRFKTHSDTEVLVHGYEVYEKDLLRHLRGMFSFALWDRHRERLFLARDRLGKKPLFYSTKAGKLAFSSEIPALLRVDWISKEISFQAMHDYLTFLCIPAPQTIFKDIHKLPPGHSLCWEKGEVFLESYWDVDYLPKIKISEHQAIEELKRLFIDAVRVRLMSEVPLGAFLSGGMDSSVVVAMMAKCSSQRIRTFSIGFDEKEFNELPLARAVARRYETDHHEQIVKPDAIGILPQLVRHFGEPFADASAIPTYYLSKMTRQTVTVALSGDGGDELLAGYRRHLGFCIAGSFQKKVPVSLRRVFVKIASLLAKSTTRQSFFGSLVRFLRTSELTAVERYLRWVGFWEEGAKKELYQPTLLEPMNGYCSLQALEKFFNSPREDLDMILGVDTKFYLPNDLLYKVDMMSMAHSLEVRCPFLDTPLIEFVSHLPWQMKMKYGQLKYLMRKAFGSDLPEENLRHRKMGFAVPMAKWIRGPLQGSLKEGLLSDETRVKKYFRQDKIREIFLKHLSGERDYAYELWALLVLEYWHREFLR